LNSLSLKPQDQRRLHVSISPLVSLEGPKACNVDELCARQQAGIGFS
jgi:hypothetical protein